MTRPRRSAEGRRDPIRSLLFNAARRDGDASELVDLAGQVDPGELVERARRHHLVSLLHERLHRLDGIPTAIVAALAPERLAAQMFCLHLHRTQRIVADVLEVPWLAIKGPVLARWWANSGTRDFNDLDVVVRPGDLATALDQLAAGGITPIGENWQGYLDHQVAEVPLEYDGTSVDLHWHLVAMGADRRHLDVPTEALFERSERVQAGGTEVLTLDPVDTLLHVCINQGVEGGRRLRGLIDIDSLVRSGSVDLDEFTRRAHQAGSGRLAAAMLQRAAAVLGTPVPADLPAALAGSRAWLAANRVVDRAATVGWHVPNGVASGLLLGSGRESAVATAGAFARSLGRGVATRAGRPGLTQPGGALDWQRRPADGRVEFHRRAYLDWVATQTLAD